MGKEVRARLSNLATRGPDSKYITWLPVPTCHKVLHHVTCEPTLALCKVRDVH
jgi:hypothetical protein